MLFYCTVLCSCVIKRYHSNTAIRCIMPLACEISTALCNALPRRTLALVVTRDAVRRGCLPIQSCYEHMPLSH